MNYDWNELAFGSKKPINQLHAVFIAAPREISNERFKQLVKQYLPKGNIVLGLAKEEYINGFENQPQFKTLKLDDISDVIDKVNSSGNDQKIYTLDYFQRDLPHLLDKLDFQKAVFINGSWQYGFHNRPEYYSLIKNKTPYELVSPFADEAEAKLFVTDKMPEIAKNLVIPTGDLDESRMIKLASDIAKFSYDYNFQIAAVLGLKVGNKYQILTTAFNKVVPYQTFAMHHGSIREKYFSPPNDLNHYDTVHAEVGIIIAAQKQKLSLKNTALFMNVMPCPVCARMLSETDIEEYIYRLDHSDGYAVKMLESADKKVRRLV